MHPTKKQFQLYNASSSFLKAIYGKEPSIKKF